MPDPELTVEPAPYQPVQVFRNDPEDPEAWKRTPGERHASFTTRKNGSGEGGDEGIPRGKRMKVVEAGTGEKEGDGCSGCLPKVDG